MHINKDSVKDLADAWSRIPDKQVKLLATKKIIFVAGDSDGGNVDPYEDTLTVYISEGVGISVIFRHEVQHVRWFDDRTDEQKIKWYEGIDKIRESTGKSPTKYVERFNTPHYTDHSAKILQTLDKFDRKPGATDDLFYNEAHSEIGAYIYEKESIMEKSNAKPWYHEVSDVMDQYVELYKNMFDD